MSLLFEELDYRPTPIGAISLRRRRQMSLGIDVYEIKLGEEFLMSSLFTASETALATLALADLQGDDLDVLVGGLGLGYTASEVLENANVGSLVVIELLDAVIDWHRTGLAPLGARLTADARCQFRQGDFFELAGQDEGFDAPGRRFDAILLDIDHSPEALLDTRSSAFYRPAALRQLARHLKPGGVFGLWSNDKPDQAFVDVLKEAFGNGRAEPVVFFNPIQERDFTQTVYLARHDG
ncbi:spermidine synthase [Hoeflea sp. CAU 1731]